MQDAIVALYGRAGVEARREGREGGREGGREETYRRVAMQDIIVALERRAGPDVRGVEAALLDVV